jgi:hypothetical protein
LHFLHPKSKRIDFEDLYPTGNPGILEDLHRFGGEFGSGGGVGNECGEGRTCSREPASS